MDAVAFVVVRSAQPGPAREWVEPLVNGQSLVDMLWHCEGGEEPAYLGRGIELLEQLKACAASSRTSGPVQLLDCACGDEGCNWAVVEVEHSPGRVTWRDVTTRNRRKDRYAGIGPFEFDRLQYEQALAHPRFVAQPPRGAPPPARRSAALQALARGEPADHRAWLEALDRATYGDAFQRGEHMDVITLGLRSFAQSGNPMSPHAAHRWVTEHGGTGATAARAVGVVQAVNALHLADARARDDALGSES